MRRKTFTDDELADPRREELLSAKVCPLFLEFAYRAAERSGMDLSKFLRRLVYDRLTPEEAAELSSLRAHL